MNQDLVVVTGPSAGVGPPREVEAAFGPVDLWIHNAMASVLAAVRERSPTNCAE